MSSRLQLRIGPCAACVARHGRCGCCCRRWCGLSNESGQRVVLKWKEANYEYNLFIYMQK